MKLTDVLNKFNLEEVDTKRVCGALGIKRGHVIVDQLEWHKFVSLKTGMGLFLQMYENSEGTGGIELLFPTSFVERYCKTVEMMEETTGVSFEENLKVQSREGNLEHYAHNYGYLQEVKQLYASLPARTQFLVKRALMGGDLQDSNFGDAGVDYLNLTSGDNQFTLKPEGDVHLRLRSPRHRRNFHASDADGLSSVLSVFVGIAEATNEDWKKIETGTLAYAHHLRDLYQPILPSSPAPPEPSKV